MFFNFKKAIKDLNFNCNWYDAIEHITKDFVDVRMKPFCAQLLDFRYS